MDSTSLKKELGIPVKSQVMEARSERGLNCRTSSIVKSIPYSLENLTISRSDLDKNCSINSTCLKTNILSNKSLPYDANFS